MLFQFLRIDATRDPQRTPEGAASDRQSEACWIMMQMRTPTGHPASQIGD